MTAYKPKKHQQQTIDKAKQIDILFDMSDPGTGKTGSQIWIFERRHKRDKKCALVIGPRTILKSAWFEDFKKFSPKLRCSIARADNRADAFAANADVYITNTDAVKWLVKQHKSFFARFSTLIIDESTNFKHHTSDRSKALNKIKKYFRFRSCLTGTPNSRSITDIWNQVFVLDDGARLGSSFYAFRSSVCTPQQVGRSAQAVNWVDKEGAEEAVFGLIADITIRHNLDDCEDIPKTHIFTMPFDMTDRQKQAYVQMEGTQIALIPEEDQEKFKQYIGGNDDVKFHTITAINAAAVRTKLLQIASGAVYQSTGKYRLIDMERYKMTIEMAQERNRPLVFFLWQHQRDELVKQAKAAKMRYAVIDGDASDLYRESVMVDYQNGMYDVVFAHPRSAAHGLTFTAGNSILWPSPTDDLEWFVQGGRRQRRLGQKRKTEVITLIAPGTVEEGVYENLMRKGKRMNNLLTLFEVKAA